MTELEVFLSPLADYKLDRIQKSIEREFGDKAKEAFQKKLARHVRKISTFPKSCEESRDFKGLYRCVVSKQISLFYRIKSDEIEIITAVYNKDNPEEIKKEIKQFFNLR